METPKKSKTNLSDQNTRNRSEINAIKENGEKINMKIYGERKKENIMLRIGYNIIFVSPGK